MKDQIDIEYGVLLETFPVKTMVVKLKGEERLRTYAITEEERVERIGKGNMSKKGNTE